MSDAVSTPDHIRGASWTRLLQIPAQFGDGYVVGWVVSSEIREPGGKRVAAPVCEWLNAVTTRDLKVRVADTSGWPAGDLEIDIKFVRTADGEVVKTTTGVFTVGGGVTA